MKRFGALFDLDGVLIDSESGYTAFWDRLEQVYPTGTPDYGMAIKGMTLTKILQNYPDPAVRDDVMRRIHDHESTMAYPVYPGVPGLLAALRAAGCQAAIVTSSDRVKMGHLKEQHPLFADSFDAVIDASCVTRSKPDPEGYIKGAAALGLSPQECIVFEDSLQGVKAGRASGATVVGIATTYPAEAIAPYCDIVVGGIADLTVERLAELVASR